MRFLGLHVADLIVANPQFAKLILLRLRDKKRYTLRGLGVHLCLAASRFILTRPADVELLGDSTDQQIERFDFRLILLYGPQFFGVTSYDLFPTRPKLFFGRLEIDTRYGIPHASTADADLIFTSY